MKEIKHTLANWVEEMGVTGAFPKAYVGDRKARYEGMKGEGRRKGHKLIQF